MRGGQNSSSRPPPSGGVAIGNPQRVLTAKDIKVIMNNPCDAAEKPEKLLRKDSKMGRKDKLQMSEKEQSQMTKSKRVHEIPQIKSNSLSPPPFQVSMSLTQKRSFQWTFASVQIPWTASAQQDTLAPCPTIHTLISCNRLFGES